MYQVISWLVVIEILGLVAFPLIFNLMNQLEDKGFSFCKPLAIATVGLASWLLSVCGILAPSTTVLYSIVVLFSIPSIYIAATNRFVMFNFIRKTWKSLLAAEIIFLLFFATFAFLRYYDPAIDHTEQPMDFAFLNASMVAGNLGPIDPWMKGEGISYYYFGYWVFGTIGKLTFLRPEIVYNLSIATIPALLGTTVYSLSANLIGSRGRWLESAAFGFLASASAVFLSNLQGLLELIRQNAIGSVGFWKAVCIEGMTERVNTVSDAWRPTDFWWWFKSSRIINYFGEKCDSAGIDYTISEFPFFSYLLGDMHPHVMSAPFIVTFLGLILVAARKKRFSGLDIGSITLAIVISISLATTIFINMWCIPLLITILISAHVIRILAKKEFNIFSPLIMCAGIIILALLLISPYLLTFKSSITGVYPAPIQTGLVHALIIWAPLLALTVPHALTEFWRSPIYDQWKISLACALVISLAPWAIRFSLFNSFEPSGPGIIWFPIPLTILIFISSLTATSKAISEGLSGRVISLYIFSLGLLLILTPELFYIGDIYGNRMNTVFKLHYQAWLLLAICSGYSSHFWYQTLRSSLGKKRLLTRIYVTVTTVIVLAGFYFVPAAMATKAAESPYESFDGLIFLREQNPQIYKAVQFVRKNITPQEGILEAVGEWGDAGIISRSSGVPNIFNWPGHQKQWRGDILQLEERDVHVKTIYETNDLKLATMLLQNYGVKYVFVGPRETATYSEDGIKKFDVMGSIVFGDSQGVRIYRLSD